MAVGDLEMTSKYASSADPPEPGLGGADEESALRLRLLRSQLKDAERARSCTKMIRDPAFFQRIMPSLFVAVLVVLVTLGASSAKNDLDQAMLRLAVAQERVDQLQFRLDHLQNSFTQLAVSFESRANSTSAQYELQLSAFESAAQVAVGRVSEEITALEGMQLLSEARAEYASTLRLRDELQANFSGPLRDHQELQRDMAEWRQLTLARSGELQSDLEEWKQLTLTRAGEVRWVFPWTDPRHQSVSGEREYPKEVVFEEPFLNCTPVLVVNSARLDARTEATFGLRYEVFARNVSAKSFTAVLQVWSDSKLNGFRATWIASCFGVGRRPRFQYDFMTITY